MIPIMMTATSTSIKEKPFELRVAAVNGRLGISPTVLANSDPLAESAKEGRKMSRKLGATV
jgi:hypothetical protein